MALLMVVFVAAGCSKKADPNKPIDQIQQEVQSMNVQDLEKTARAYADEIMKRTQDIDKVKEELKGFSPQDLLGEKAKTIKADLGRISRPSVFLRRFINSPPPRESLPPPLKRPLPRLKFLIEIDLGGDT
jgi:hypothetical protein